MIIIFNQLGAIISTTIEPVRQGDSQHTLRVTFEGKRNFDYIARFNLTRPDGTSISNVLMDVDPDILTDFTANLDSEWYFALHGTCTLTVFLVDGAERQIANGQVTIPVQQTDYDDEPTITRDEYLELLSRFALYLLKTGGEISGDLSVVGTLTGGFASFNNVEATSFKRNNVELADENQLRSEVLRAQRVEAQILDYFTDGIAKRSYADEDGNNIKSTYVSELYFDASEVTSTNRKLGLALYNKNGELIDEVKFFNIPSAVENGDAGLMSGQDKANLENVIKDLESEITAREEADDLKEDKSNKQSTLSSASTDVDYPSSKAVYDFVNSSINNLTAFYITKNAEGDAFDSVADLLSASYFYSGGELRNPTKNDYCIVRVDENHENATTRYIYQRDSGAYSSAGWDYQYTVNETPLTQAQLQAINSGITDAKVSAFEQGLLDIEERIRYEDAETNGNFITGFYIEGIYHAVAQEVNVRPNVEFIPSTDNLPPQNDGKLYFVLSNNKLYRWVNTEWRAIDVYNPLDFVTTFSDQVINAIKSFALGKGVTFQSLAGYYQLRAGNGGIEIWNTSGTETEMYEINANGIRPIGTRDLGASNRTWQNIWANYINGLDVDKIANKDEVVAKTTKIVNIPLNADINKNDLLRNLGMLIEVEGEEYSYQLKVVNGKPQLHYEKL